jgi:hypothetical protein
MTREEEILHKASIACISSNAGRVKEDYFNGFIVGARWADNNPNWVSVKKQLPIGLGRVLFVLDNDYVYIGEYNDEAESNKFGMPSAFLRLRQRVTHWMELPNRPKR